MALDDASFFMKMSYAMAIAKLPTAQSGIGKADQKADQEDDLSGSEISLSDFMTD